MKANRKALPPNPYTRQPIKRKDRLAGRREELEEIRYYLNLTTAGQSYHLALIGHRGTGKTSLLNAAETTARELKLLPVRIDLNESKARTPGEFWYDVYSTLVLELETAGCWNRHSALFGALHEMIVSRKRPTDDGLVVLRLPFAIASHQGALAEMQCVDSIIVHDFNKILEELKIRGLSGIALLIDEADCLGQNRPLIQMFRNIFQRVDACSLVLAGTDAIFPTLSDVFSPIPRQFHRISVKSFSHWGQTRDLIIQPFSLPQYENFKDILPRRGTVQELHELCGGSPDELQLYCHHMYKQVETRTSHEKPRLMALVPHVFREVLNEYRASTPVGNEDVLDRVEKLPDKLLYQSPWLRRRLLRVPENCQCVILGEELKRADVLPASEQQNITRDVEDGYAQLNSAQVTKDPERLEVLGGALTYGFWKSFVEVEKKIRWTWSDETFEETVIDLCVNSILSATDGFIKRELGETEQIVDSLALLRQGCAVDGVNGMWFTDIQLTTSLSRERHLSSVIELILCIGFAGKTRRFKSSHAGAAGLDLFQKSVEEWLALRKPVLDAHQIVLRYEKAAVLQLPTDREIHRLAWIGDLGTFDEFGPSDHKLAFDAYAARDLAKAISLFEGMLADRNESGIRNNLAYCLILQGSLEEAAKQYEAETWPDDDDRWPMWHHNRGVLAVVKGDCETGRRYFRETLACIESKGSSFDSKDVVCMLLLTPDVSAVTSRDGLAVDAAALINLYLVEKTSHEELRRRLCDRYPEEHATWLAWLSSDP